MSLDAVALAAILATARAPAVDVAAERPRLEALAATIAHAAQAHPWALGAEPAALALVAVAHHESGYRAEVADCRITGDRHRGEGPTEGASVGLWQLHRGQIGRAHV